MTELRRQKTLTVLTRIAEGRESALRQLLESIQEKDVEKNPLIPFTELRGLHFARWSIVSLGGDPEGEDKLRYLLFASVFDGALKDHLAMWCSSEPTGESGLVAGAGIDRIYENCEGFGLSANPVNRVAYLKAHSIPVHTFYIGAVGRSVEEIRAQARMRALINRRLADPSHLIDFSEPLSLHRQIRDFLQEEYQGAGTDSFAKVTQAADVRPGWPQRLAKRIINLCAWLSWKKLGAAALFGVVYIFYRFGLWGFLTVAGLLLLAYLVRRYIRRCEFRDDEERQAWRQRCKANANTMLQKTTATRLNEDHIGQNAITSMIRLKPGLVRLLWTRLVFLGIHLGASLLHVDGSLAGIRSIHFGRWAVVRRPRALLFISDYDGSWESYLGDFISEGPIGMTGIWTNSVYFPRTRFLFWGGVTDEHAFKAYSRAMMSRTHVFYSAYKHLSVANIIDNGRICAGVGKELDEEEAWEWAKLLSRRFT